MGDYFTVTVPAGGGQYKAINFSGVDGSAKAAGILGPYDVNASASGQRTLDFTSGGTYEIMPGDVITGATSRATARVLDVEETSGFWANGDMIGTITVDSQVGDFEAENLDIRGISNVATIAGNSTAVVAVDKPGAALVKDCEYTANNLIWPVDTTAAQKEAAQKELSALGIDECR